jgi:hypothetical protein
LLRGIYPLVWTKLNDNSHGLNTVRRAFSIVAILDELGIDHKATMLQHATLTTRQHCYLLCQITIFSSPSSDTASKKSSTCARTAEVRERRSSVPKHSNLEV